MIAYKLVCEIDDKYYSLTKMAAKTEYVRHKYVGRQEGCGPMACFEDRADAEKFLTVLQDHHPTGNWVVLFECNIIPSSEYKLYENKLVYPMPVPIGTVFADEVQLSKKIHAGGFSRFQSTGEWEWPVL